MDRKNVLIIKKRTQPEWLVWMLIVFPFLLGTLNGLLKLPWAIRYLMDVTWMTLLLFLLRFKQSVNIKNTGRLSLWVILFLLYASFVYIVQFQSPFYFLWGTRNNFRFYAAFFSFAAFLTLQDIECYFKLFDKLFWLNVIVSLFQFFALKINQDYLGGIFGAEIGSNGYTSLFFSIAVTKSILFYLEKRETAWECFSKCIAAVIVAAFAELKFFYVEVIVIIVFAVMFTNFTWRKFWVIAGGLAAVSGGAMLLAVVFPEFAGFLSIEYFLKSATSNKGVTSSGDLNRLNAIPRINELWLTNWGQRLFGLGLGNCDTSSFAMVNTPFFEKYGDMHYTWRSYAMMYLECGWIGLIFYFGFFVLVYFAIRKIERRCEGVSKTYCRISRIVAVLCVIIAIYNSSLRTEAGYMAYFVLAIPFALGKKQYHPDGQNSMTKTEVP